MILIITIFAFIITFYLINVILILSKKYKLYDTPDELRKIHFEGIPNIAGLAIFITMFIILNLCSFYNNDYNFTVFLFTVFLFILIGLKDDLLEMKALNKLFYQVMIVILYFVLTHKHENYIFTNSIINFTFLTIAFVYIINSFNLIDGIDGLAGSLSLIAAIFYSIYFYLFSNYELLIISLVVIGSLLAFLYFNFFPAKIFLGDVGSLSIGFIFSFLALEFNCSMPTISNIFIIKLILPFSFFLIPLIDTFRVFILRILNGKSPFSADSNHIHHILLRHGLSQKQIVLALSGTQILISSFVLFILRHKL